MLSNPSTAFNWQQMSGMPRLGSYRAKAASQATSAALYAAICAFGRTFSEADGSRINAGTRASATGRLTCLALEADQARAFQ
jgi:hypothetical protein